MNRRIRGVVVRVAYYADDRDFDHVTVRTENGDLVDAYRCDVEESGPQECVDEPGRRFGPYRLVKHFRYYGDLNG